MGRNDEKPTGPVFRPVPGVNRFGIMPAAGRAPVVRNIANEDMTDLVRYFLLKYPRLSPDEFGRIYPEQFAQYNRALVETGLAMSKPDVMALDRIDMSSLARKNGEKNQIPELTVDGSIRLQVRLFSKDPDMGFYRQIPCFSEGVIRVNVERYVYFRMLHMDMESESFRVFLRDYAEVRGALPDQPAVWQSGVYGTVDLRFRRDDGSCAIIVDPDNCGTFSSIYRQIPPKELGWDKIRREAWKHIALANAERARTKFGKAGTHPVVRLAEVFSSYVVLSNYILETNKAKLAPGQARRVSRPDTESNKSDTHAVGKPDMSRQDIPDKLVRNVGLIRVVSEKPPRTFSSKSSRNYKIPSWTARGHVRTYKSGKTVYVRPTVRHRKSLGSGNAKAPQSVINVNAGADKE